MSRSFHHSVLRWPLDSIHILVIRVAGKTQSCSFVFVLILAAFSSVRTTARTTSRLTFIRIHGKNVCHWRPKANFLKLLQPCIRPSGETPREFINTHSVGLLHQLYCTLNAKKISRAKS